MTRTVPRFSAHLACPLLVLRCAVVGGTLSAPAPPVSSSEKFRTQCRILAFTVGARLSHVLTVSLDCVSSQNVVSSEMLHVPFLKNINDFPRGCSRLLWKKRLLTLVVRERSDACLDIDRVKQPTCSITRHRTGVLANEPQIPCPAMFRLQSPTTRHVENTECGDDEDDDDRQKT